MKRFKIFTVLIILIFIGGCGKKEPPTMGIGYSYLNRYDNCVDVICPDGSLYNCNTGDLEDYDYNDGCVYFIKADNMYRADISNNELYPLLEENEFRRVCDEYCIRPIVSVGNSGKVAVQLYKRESDHSSIYIIDNGKMEYLCEVDGSGINNNSSVNLNKVPFCADKSGEYLFVKQNNELVKFDIQNKAGTTLIADFKYDIFDVDASGEKAAYIYENNIYLYDISSGKETQIGEMEFPVGKIKLSDDGSRIMVMDTTSKKGGLADYVPGPGINVLYIYDCANGKAQKIVEGGCGNVRGGFDFAE
jgi:hypothetical protein